jgi:hypothetical protein
VRGHDVSARGMGEVLRVRVRVRVRVVVGPIGRRVLRTGLLVVVGGPGMRRGLGSGRRRGHGAAVAGEVLRGRVAVRVRPPRVPVHALVSVPPLHRRRRWRRLVGVIVGRARVSVRCLRPRHRDPRVLHRSVDDLMHKHSADAPEVVRGRWMDEERCVDATSALDHAHVSCFIFFAISDSTRTQKAEIKGLFASAQEQSKRWSKNSQPIYSDRTTSVICHPKIIPNLTRSPPYNFSE